MIKIPFWNRRQPSTSATVDEAQLIERANQIMPAIGDAMRETFLNASPKEQKKLLKLYRATAKKLETLTPAELEAFIDMAEAGKKYRDKLRSS